METNQFTFDSSYFSKVLLKISPISVNMIYYLICYSIRLIKVIYFFSKHLTQIQFNFHKRFLTKSTQWKLQNASWWALSKTLTNNFQFPKWLMQSFHQLFFLSIIHIPVRVMQSKPIKSVNPTPWIWDNSLAISYPGQKLRNNEYSNNLYWVDLRGH